MQRKGVKFETKSPGLIECNVSGESKKWRGLCVISASVRAGENEIDWKWSESVQTGEEAIRCEARSSGLLLDLALANQDGLINLDLSLRPDGTQAINYCLLNLDFFPDGLEIAASGRLDDCRVPHLAPKPGLVMADMIFRSPAIVVRRGTLAMALLPDLNCLRETRPAPWVMDFDRNGPRRTPRLTLGLMRHRPYRHVYFMSRPEENIDIPDQGLTLSGHLIVSADAGEDFPRRVQRFLWEHYGIPNYRAVKPQVLSLDELSREAMSRLFKREDFYHEFEYNGAIRAGLTTFTATTIKPIKPAKARLTPLVSHFNGIGIHILLTLISRFGQSERADERLCRYIHKRGIPKISQAWFQSWFNNLRTAYGARILADRWGDDGMREQANRIKELALSAPVEDGIFSAICFFPEGKVWWKRGSLTFMATEDYHTPDQATTGYIMLRWYQDIEQDPALLEMARGLGRFFLKHQLASGAVPAWIRGRTHRHLPRLRESASTAGPMMFMAMLTLVDKDRAALAGARRMAEFIERTVIPEHKWFDYETFYSCSRPPKNSRDPRTGIPPQNTMSMLWAAEGARLLFEITGEEQYRELLLKCLDYLLFYHQVWDAPVHSINTFGGFGSMNTDAEWNDARQGIIAPALMDSYGITGDPHHFQRGVSAVRACYTTMLLPALEEVAPGNMVHYRESDRGAIYENYGHSGYDRVIAGYQHADWGAGTAAFATAHALKLYGDVFVDLNLGHAFGINGCNVKKLEQERDTVRLTIDSLIPDLNDWRVVLRGVSPDTRLLVNGSDHVYENV